MPDYGVSGPTRRYALIVGMLVALATVPTLVVLAVGAAWVGGRQSGGTPPRGASTGDPVIVVSAPPACPRAADPVTVPPAGPATSSPVPSRPAPVAAVALPAAPAPAAPAPRRPAPAWTTPSPTVPAPTPTDPAPTDPAPSASPPASDEPTASPTPEPIGSVPETEPSCRDRWRKIHRESVGTPD